MQIDWLTVAAQIVNFLVLVWLLQRFLYRPITNAMRRREERIEERLAEAKAAREEAEEEAASLKRKKAELEESKEGILSSAREEADELREKLKGEIRKEMEEKRDAWRAHLAEEREAFVSALQRKAGQQILDITGHILAEYADMEISERLVATFADRLASLNPDKRAKLTEAASEAETAVVETGAALTSSAKRRITRALHDVLSSDIDVDYREDEEMVLGVRLTIGGVTAEWSAARYLDRLRAELDEAIDLGSHGGGPEQEHVATAERGSG
ncbi:F0F1 ATP synthase subunit delta [Ruegeria marina]|uniref:ATP synthase subunit b n=1 Tax=Ruegeria marina TaxID=639004 RepID=A0A1G6IAZ6_9RHOB|nr:F0F1 ATP synthase subunit delta [Ruegeria marina]SDC02916.1 F-type H+-transporting ATPase subunit b [Ruegeria marina]